MGVLSPDSIQSFRDLIYRYYAHHKRDFPWRQTTDPYAILISEYMLQQTQTERVVPKYMAWMNLFPSVQAAAQASLHDILEAWQGLGYNRRGLNLHKALQLLVEHNESVIPSATEELQQLPGIGPYTAAAISAFAFNRPTLVLETNIRAVYLYYFIQPSGKKVADDKILPYVEETLDRDNPREWYYALMDYGVMIKKTFGNVTRHSKHYTKQSRFAGSNRQKRGEILRQLTRQGRLQLDDYPEWVQSDWQKALQQLEKEGLVVRDKQSLRIT